jgi:heat shock protein HslJ
MSVELGRWQLVDAKRRLELDGGAKGSYGVSTPTRLVAADLVHHLDRLPQWNPIGGPVDVRGEYFSVDGSSRLTECKTGKTFPVAMAGEDRELEDAYLAQRVVTGSPMLVTFEGRLARVTDVDGKAGADAFVIERFERLWPSARCSTRLALPFVNTRWRLVELGGAEVDVEEGSPELTFGENGRLTGSTGCNRVNAPYTRRDTAVSLGPVGATRRACAEPTKRDLEARFDAMLRNVDGYELERTELVLMHGATPISRFVAAE